MEKQPDNIRLGAPYDQPAFESLCREMGIWGTAQAALCAVFWRKAEATLAESVGAGGVSALVPAARDASDARPIVAHLLHRHRFARRLYRQAGRDWPSDANLSEWAHENEAWNAYVSSKQLLHRRVR